MRRLLMLLLLASVGVVAAQAAPRIVLFDAREGTTARALQALPVPCQVAPPSDYGAERLSLFGYQVAIWGMDDDQTPLNSDPQPLLDFVRSGGVFLAMRMPQDCQWAPVPLKMDKAYALGALAKPDHPLFAAPNALSKDTLSKVHGGSIYRAFYDLGRGWVPLVSTGAEQTWDKTPAVSTGPHYGLVELPYGKGRIILCQMIPEYGFVNDDKSQPGANRQLLQNLTAYVSAMAPKWPAPKARMVPASFHRDLGDLLRTPTAQGTLPMADSAWKITTQGAFTCKADRRGVMTMSHADRPAAAGDFAEMTRTVSLPRGAGVSPAAARVFLRFHNSDDYCGGSEPKMVGDARVSTHENRIKDTRFKQVLVNGKVVWEEDVLGLNPVPATRRFHLVDITDAVGKSPSAAIALRVQDCANTAEDQPFATDVYWASLDLLPGIIQVPVAEEATKVAFNGPAGKYAVLVQALDEHTGQGKLQVSIDGKPLGTAQLTADDYRSYWIDFGQTSLKPGSAIALKATPDGGEACAVQSIALVPASLLAAAVPGSAGIPAGLSPSSPLYKPGPAITRATFPVLVSGPAAYKPHGEVVSGGMPFAYGAVKSEQNLRLLNDQNKKVPLQTRVLARWPDNSLKWVLFTFPTGPGALRCEYGTQVKREAAVGLTVTQDDKTISIDTGPLQVTISKSNGDLCETLALEGKQLKPAGVRWPLVIGVGQDKYSSDGDTVTRCEVVDGGPERATIRRVGRFRSVSGKTMLEYDLLMTFDANSGVIRIQPTITHKEGSPEEQLNGLLVEVKTPLLGQGGERARVWFAGDSAFAVRSVRECGWSLWTDLAGVFHATEGDGGKSDSFGGRTSGFLRVAGDGLSIDLIPRWFWQMYPASNHGFSDGLSFGLGRVTLHQGEAIWNDFALRFSTDTGQPVKEDFDALANPAVALAEPSYTASTLALCQFTPENKAIFPEYEETVESQYKGFVAKREARHEYGVENFGDDTFEWGYGPSYTFWSNQEYDHHYGMLLQFLRSGDWRWWEIGDAGTRHHVNEDCYHWTPAGQEYRLGSPHHHNSKHLVDTGWVADHTVAGSDVTHAWVEGQIAYYFMTGDPRTFENWNAMGDWYVWCVNNNQYGAGGQERGPGWTLVALSALYNATYDQKYLDAGSKVMDWLRSVQDPVRGVISIPISEQPSYEGGSAFMHGIVARGAGRWYEATGDERGRLAALGIADWLTSEAMGPPSLFYYKQAPLQKGSYSISEWQCLSALTYAMKYGDAARYGPPSEAHYLSGRAGERSMAWVPQSLSLLQQRFWPYRARWSTPQAVVAPATPAEMRLQLVNASDQPLQVTLKVLSAPAGATVTAPLKPVTLAPRAAADALVTVAVKQLNAASGSVRLQLLSNGVSREMELPVIAVPVVVRVQKTAAEGQLQAPFILDKDNTALAPRDAAFTGNPHQPGERAGWVGWQVDVPAAGAYTLSADCWWLDEKGNSLYLQVDDGPEVVIGNDGDLGRWHPVRAPEALKLSAGTHTLRLINREEGTRVRSLTLTNVP